MARLGSDIRMPGRVQSAGNTENSFPFADGRCVRLTGHDTFALPAAGGDVDAVTGVFYMPPLGSPDFWFYYFPAVPGHQVQVEAGETIFLGDLLETMADGRVRRHTTGTAVLRALRGGSAGELVWCVFTSGR